MTPFDQNIEVPGFNAQELRLRRLKYILRRPTVEYMMAILLQRRYART